MIQREDGYVDLTEMFRKLRVEIRTYRQSPRHKQFSASLSEKLNVPLSMLIQTRKARGAHTWVHPAIALDAAFWAGADNATEVALFMLETIGMNIVPTTGEKNESNSKTCQSSIDIQAIE